MNHLFSFKRFWLLTKKEIIDNKKLFLIGSIAIFALMIGFIYLPVLTKFDYLSNDYYTGTYVISMMILASILGSFAFKAFSTKPTTIEYLTLPANASEKFLSKFFIYTIVFNIAYTLIFTILTLHSISLYKQWVIPYSTIMQSPIYLNRLTFSWSHQLLAKGITFAIVIILLQLVFYAGTVSIKRYSFVLTIIITLAVLSIFQVYATYISDIFFHSVADLDVKFPLVRSSITLSTERNAVEIEKIYTLPKWLIIWKYLAFFILPIALLMATVCMKIKEKQLK